MWNDTSPFSSLISLAVFSILSVLGTQLSMLFWKGLSLPITVALVLLISLASSKNVYEVFMSWSVSAKKPVPLPDQRPFTAVSTQPFCSSQTEEAVHSNQNQGNSFYRLSL